MKKLITICVVVGLLLTASANVKGTITDPCLSLHFNGENGSTNMVDSTGRHTITPHGDAHLDTAEKKYGSASLLLDGSGDYLTIADSADWDICGSATDDKTFDFWVKHDTVAGAQCYASQIDGIGWELLQENGQIRFLHSSASIMAGYGGSLTTDWHHIALCKVGSKYACYIDGQQVNYANSTNTATVNSPLYIGSYETSLGIKGHIDELRIVHSNIFGANPNPSLTDTITNIPEPATICLLGLGALSLVRRKK